MRRKMTERDSVSTICQILAHCYTVDFKVNIYKFFCYEIFDLIFIIPNNFLVFMRRLMLTRNNRVILTLIPKMPKPSESALPHHSSHTILRSLQFLTEPPILQRHS